MASPQVTAAAAASTRTEAQVRATRIPCRCPWCGWEPNNATKNRYGYFMVGCENEDCAVQPQVSDTDMSRAWKIWNQRA